jgi:hypothetical protein
LLGNQFFGKFVGEVGAAHGGEFTALAAGSLNRLCRARAAWPEPAT